MKHCRLIKAARQLRLLVLLPHQQDPFTISHTVISKLQKQQNQEGENVTTVLLLAKLWEALTRLPTPLLSPSTGTGFC